MHRLVQQTRRSLPAAKIVHLLMHTPEREARAHTREKLDRYFSFISRDGHDNDDTASVRKMQKNATGNILQQRTALFRN